MAENKRRAAKKASGKKKTAPKKSPESVAIFTIKEHYKIAEPQLTRLQRIFASLCVVMVAIFGLALSDNIDSLRHWNTAVATEAIAHVKSLSTQYQLLKQDVLTLEQAQGQYKIMVVEPASLDQQLAGIQTDLNLGHHHSARTKIITLSQQVANWQLQLNLRVASEPQAAGALAVPILLYHYTPPDFDTQLSLLSQKGYTAITLDDLAAALHHQKTLPAKPVIITFDDGFANQMAAFQLLKKHNLKATYYIIDGGQESHWCIGANRRPQNCGDAYLTWDQVRELDHSGIITIGAHTIDHLNLASKPVAEQRYQIMEGKRELEAEIGHPVHDFAYPYGAFNATTIALVKEAGFDTAVTTLPGEYQSLANIYTLRRVRDVRALP